MATPPGFAAAIGLPFEEAKSFFWGKVPTATRHWDEVWKEAHTRAFMVAGAASEALLADFQAAIKAAIGDGMTLSQFRARFDEIVARHGWVYNGGPAWRSQIIYETNVAMAHAAGRYAQMTDPDVLDAFPYWQYEHTSSARPRPQHLAWVGTTLRADDAWWGTHYPPNGWRCKCGVRPVSEPGLRRMGKSGPDTAPEIERVPWRNPRTGRVELVPEGISPGFDYNVGEAWQKGGGMPPAAPVPTVPPSPLSPPPAPRAQPAPVSAPERMPTIEPAPAPLRPRPVEPTPDTAPKPVAPTPASKTPVVLAPSGMEAVPADVLQSFLADPHGMVQVGRLPPDTLRRLGAKSDAVLLSAETLAKQRAHHPDLTDALYHDVVAAVLRAPEWTMPNVPLHLRLLRVHQGRMTSVVIKRTRDNAQTLLVNAHYLGRKTLRALVRKHPLLAGDAEALLAWLAGAAVGPAKTPHSASVTKVTGYGRQNITVSRRARRDPSGSDAGNPA